MRFFRDWYQQNFGMRKQTKRQSKRKAKQPRRARFEQLEIRQMLVNEIVAENLLPGNPKSEWDVVAGGDSNIEGFTTDISVNQGGTVQFKINTDSNNYRLDIYRMGYYGGMGARKVATVQPSASLPQIQPDPERDFSTGLVDAGNWGVSASWTVPANATSGIYFAKLVREDATPGSNHVVFVVRDDDGASDLLFQTSDATWQAYNAWGGSSTYAGSPAGRAFKVSYNRPVNIRTVTGGMGETNFVFWGEYPMVRWLEMNGYDVSYSTNVDTARRGQEILEHDAFLSNGHDEYWSAEMYNNVEAARDAGVSLAFFTGNELYWKTRWEPSIDGTNTDWRTLVTYKESVVGAEGIDPATLPPGVQLGYNSENNVHDPSPIWTGLWRDLRFSPPGDAKVEQLLTGQLFSVNRGPGGTFGTAIQVPEADGKMRFWRNTNVATLGPGEVATLSNGTLGYEWDEDSDTGYRPAGSIRLSSTTEFVPEKLVDPLSWPGCEGVVGSACSLCRGCMVAPGQATHTMTMYRDPESKAIVFGAGTVQWSWGLDGNHDGVPTVPDSRMQQATINLFADMGVQPETLQANLLPATASTDETAPISIITSPSGGLLVQSGSTPVTITGTASDAGGKVGGIEISVDGGTNWRRAEGRESWSYSWIPSTPGTISIKTRASDDSLNLETPGAGISVTVVNDQTTAPAISNVTALVVNNQTAIITWTTDEASDSRVIFGTSANTLNQNVYLGAAVTSHSVTLAGLTPNTNYFYRVISVDEYANSSTSPATLAAPNQVSTPAITDTTSGQFAAGTLDAGVTLSETVDGEVQLKPAVQAEFSGSALPSGWSATPYAAGGTVTVNGAATVNGSRMATDSFFGPGRSLEFVATFTGDPFQTVGFATDLSAQPWATFSSFSGGKLYARTAGSGGLIDTLIPGNWLGSSHRFRIDWGSSVVKYFIDGVEVASHTVTISAAMRPVASDFQVGGGALVVDWMRMGPYVAAGSYVSRVFDAGAAVVWTHVSWIADVPAGTGLIQSVRMGNTPTPDASWTDFVPILASGDDVGGRSRYLQYRTELSTTNADRTPVLHNVALSYNTSSNADTFAPTIVVKSPAPGAINVSPALAVVVKFSELMDATTINSGTVRLRKVGETTDVAANVSFTGSTAILQPVEALAPEAEYAVTISGTVKDASGNPLGNAVTWSFTTGWLAFTDTSPADFQGGQSPGNTIAATDAGDLTLAPELAADFSGAALPPGWLSQTWQSGGSATVAAGRLTVDGAMSATSAYFGSGKTIEFSATFTGEAYQTVGLGTDFSNPPWAIFTTGAGGSLRAKTNFSQEMLLPGVALGVPHLFRIHWTASSVSYFVDGAQVAVHAEAIGASLRPVASDYSPGGGAVAVDWLRVLPYAASGSFESRVYDAGEAVAWTEVLYSASVPAGTSLAVSARVGNTPTPDASWTDFTPVASSGQSLGALARYAQYQIMMTSSAAADYLITPALHEISLRYSAQVNDETAPAVLGAAPSSGQTEVDSDSAVVVRFNDLLAVTSVNSTSFSLREVGGSADVPANIQVSGSRMTLQPLSALAPNTLYEVTVAGSITDAAGNPLGSEVHWTFTTEWLKFTETTSADFAQGTLSGASTGATADGEIVLAPLVLESFSGSGVPSGWNSAAWNSGGGTAVGGGVATVDGAMLSTSAMFQPGSTVEFTATLTGDAYQHMGWGVDLSGPPWAMFSTREGNALYARTSSMGDTLISGSWLGASHCFKIEWKASEIRFFIDETLVASHATALTTPMRPLASDYATGGGAITVSEVRVIPYMPSGSYESRVFDAGLAVTWDAAAWSAELPAGTSAVVSVRMGASSVPDGSWTEYVPLASTGATVGGVSRYLQYRVALNTTNVSVTPTFNHFSIRYTSDADTIAPQIVARSPASGATGQDLFASVKATLSELLDPTSVSATSVRLRASGAPSDVPATVTLAGGTISLQPLQALASNTSYEVTVAGSVRDISGNPLGANAVWSFSTGSGQWQQTSLADFSAGTHSGTAAGSGGSITLAGAFLDEFSGTSLDPGWSIHSWSSEGGGPTQATVADGTLKLAGGMLRSAGIFTNQPLAGRVRFAAAPYQYFGLATDLSSFANNSWAVFSTGGTTDTLIARVNNNGSNQDVVLGALPAGFHDYRIVPSAGAFAFYVDGVLRTTIAASFLPATPVRIALSSYHGPGSGLLEVDSLRIESYAVSGEFLSSVYDATRTATWGTATWTANLPASTTLVVETRSGDAATPDGSWSTWSAVASGGSIASPASRYLQYRVRLTTTATDTTPELLDLAITWL
jgi:hypothetical protein